MLLERKFTELNRGVLACMARSVIVILKFSFILLIGLSLTVGTYGAAVAVEEYEVKAGYLRHLGKFASWPDDVFSHNKMPFTICVLGKSPFSPAIIAALNSKEVQGRKLRLLLLEITGHQAKQCQILFISRSETPIIQAILTWAKTRPILTVSDIDDFVKFGGMIEMSAAGNGISLFINLPESRNSNITISAELLSLATVIGD